MALFPLTHLCARGELREHPLRMNIRFWGVYKPLGKMESHPNKIEWGPFSKPCPSAAGFVLAKRTEWFHDYDLEQDTEGVSHHRASPHSSLGVLSARPTAQCYV